MPNAKKRTLYLLGLGCLMSIEAADLASRSKYKGQSTKHVFFGMKNARAESIQPGHLIV